MSISIRKMRDEDALEVADLIEKGFRSIISRDYPRKSVEWQIIENSPEKLIEKAKTVKYFIAIDEDEIVGIGGYDGKKVHTFFVKPEFQGKGIGSKILEKVLSEAKKDRITALKSWATFNSIDFYKKFGFKEIKELTVSSGNNSITFMEMEKKL